MKYYPSSQLVTGGITDSEAFNQEMRSAASFINRLDRENFNHSSIGVDALAPAACNKFYVNYIGGPYTYKSTDISGGWQVLGALTQSITTEEGVLRGAFSGTIERFAFDGGPADIYKPWRIGVFVDGQLVAETDQIWSVVYGLDLAYATPVVAGAHTITICLRAEIKIPTKNGATTSDVLKVHETIGWQRLAKR